MESEIQFLLRLPLLVRGSPQLAPGPGSPQRIWILLRLSTCGRVSILLRPSDETPLASPLRAPPVSSSLGSRSVSSFTAHSLPPPMRNRREPPLPSRKIQTSKILTPRLCAPPSKSSSIQRCRRPALRQIAGQVPTSPAFPASTSTHGRHRQECTSTRPSSPRPAPATCL